MLIFSNISSSTGAYRYLQKILWVFIVALMMTMIIRLITIIIKSPFNFLKVGFDKTFCKYFFCVLPSSAEHGCKQALACFNIWPRVCYNEL